MHPRQAKLIATSNGAAAMPLSVTDPYTGVEPDSLYAMWHDPLAYDHMEMGPPYLPEGTSKFASSVRGPERFKLYRAANAAPLEQIFSHLVGEYSHYPMSELAVLLSCLRAAAFVHQTHHWQTRGDTFYADHLLYERLYNDSLPMIDQLAERTVGSGHHLLVHPVIQSGQVASLVKFFVGDIQTNLTTDESARVSLVTEVQLLALLSMVYQTIEGKQQLSPGTDNLLQDGADKHESFVYLLRQRNQVKQAYDRR